LVQHFFVRHVFVGVNVVVIVIFDLHGRFVQYLGRADMILSPKSRCKELRL
jgi:hypothetical protein